MREILKDLYFGRVPQPDRSILRSSEYDKAMRKCKVLEDELRKLLPDDKFNMLDDISDVFNKISNLNRVEDFIYGFQMGAQIMAAVFETDTYC